MKPGLTAEDVATRLQAHQKRIESKLQQERDRIDKEQKLASSFQPRINKNKDMNSLQPRAPIHERVGKILKAKTDNIEALTEVAKEARKDFMRKNLGMEADEELLEANLKKPGEQQKLDPQYFEQKYRKQLEER